MREFEVPRVGFVLWEPSDLGFLALAVVFVLLGVEGAISGASDLALVGIGLVQVLAGVLLGWVTLVQGRRRVQYEEWANPVRQMEAWRNHALAEGL